MKIHLNTSQTNNFQDNKNFNNNAFNILFDIGQGIFLLLNKIIETQPRQLKFSLSTTFKTALKKKQENSRRNRRFRRKQVFLVFETVLKQFLTNTFQSTSLVQ